jgi:hypothetical protein
LVKRHGKQFRKSLKTTDRQLAERRLSALRLKIGRNGNPDRDSGTTCLELSRDWFDVVKTRLKPSSARGVEGSLRQLNKHFGLLAVRNLTTAHCHDWEKNRGAKISPSTFNHDRSTLIGLLNHAVREGDVLT